ncbi:MAG TPA: right-handed parallel beta-helix repeat-containing protein [Blastocatellia bacterium]|nr:right-handed parallel beta-helix repeat-containing protein [Blastocatellia bacterium]
MEANPSGKGRRMRRVVLPLAGLFIVVTLASLAFAVAVDWEPANTIVVAGNGRGDYSTIGEALQNAKPNGRIRVKPGVYREGLTITKPVEIVGQVKDDSYLGRLRWFLRPGEREAVVVESSESASLFMRAERATIRGITLKSMGEAAGNPVPAVVVVEGDLVLEDCKITCEMFAGVGIQGSVARCSIKRTTITDCGLNGVLAVGGATLLIEDSEIAANKFAAVRIEERATAIVRRSKLIDGIQGGLLVLNNGFAALEDCDFYGNGISGLEVREQGKAHVSNSRFQHNVGGVYVHRTGSATISGCDISHNSAFGILVCDEGSVEARHSKIHNIRRNGIEFSDNSSGSLDGCSVFDNAAVGIMITKGSSPVVRDCETYGNKYSGIQIFTNANPTIQRSTLKDGVVIAQKGEGIFEDCDFVNTKYTPVSIKEGGNPTLRRCKMRDGRGGGVYVFAGGAGIVEDCDIYGNHCAGIGIADGGNPIIRRTRINRNREPAVRMFEGGLGRIEDCDLTDNKGGAWRIEGNCNVEKVRNKEQ